MAHERRRAALAALCVFAVALTATLLPASGFGSQPAGVGLGDGGPDAPPGESGPDATDPQATVEPTPTTATTSDADATTRGQDRAAESTTATTETTVAGEGDVGGDGALGALVVVPLAVLGLLSLLALVGFWTGVLALTSAAGLVPFTVEVGGTPLGELAGRVPTRTMALVVGLSSSVPRLLDDAANLSREVSSSLGSVVAAAGRGTGEALSIGARGLAATFAAVPRALAGLGAGAGIFGSLGNLGVPSISGDGGDGNEDSGNAGGGSDAPADARPPSVEEAWEDLRDSVPVRNRDARTPGEVARAAARRGYPDEAVRRLTDAFREVRYGDLPRDGRTDSARSALDRLRDYWRGEE